MDHHPHQLRIEGTSASTRLRDDERERERETHQISPSDAPAAEQLAPHPRHKSPHFWPTEV
jgi:hypothetical protein